MRIRMNVGIAGADFALQIGDETERFTDGEARALIANGSAVPVEARKIETATKPAPPAGERRAPTTTGLPIDEDDKIRSRQINKPRSRKAR